MPLSIGLGASCIFLYYSTYPRMSLLPNLQFESLRKRNKNFPYPRWTVWQEILSWRFSWDMQGYLYLCPSKRNIVLINPLLYTGIIPLILISFSQFTLANHPYQMFNKCLEALPTLPYTQVQHFLSWLFLSNNISCFLLLLISAFTFFHFLYYTEMF